MTAAAAGRLSAIYYCLLSRCCCTEAAWGRLTFNVIKHNPSLACPGRLAAAGQHVCVVVVVGCSRRAIASKTKQYVLHVCDGSMPLTWKAGHGTAACAWFKK